MNVGMLIFLDLVFPSSKYLTKVYLIIRVGMVFNRKSKIKGTEYADV